MVGWLAQAISLYLLKTKASIVFDFNRHRLQLKINDFSHSIEYLKCFD